MLSCLSEKFQKSTGLSTDAEFVMSVFVCVAGAAQTCGGDAVAEAEPGWDCALPVSGDV